MSAPAVDDMHARLAALSAAARTRARATGSRVLVSVAAPAPVVDPLGALAAMTEAADVRAGGGGETNWMYWTRPADDFTLAGFGSVVVFSERGADRFATIDRQWTTLHESALVDDPSGGAPGVGPLLMGGFAFDAGGPMTDRWRGFPSARLVVPRVQLSVNGGERWLTLNLLVTPNGEPDAEPDALVALWTRTAADPLARKRTRSGAPRREALGWSDARPAFAWRAAVGDAVAAIRGGVLEKVVLAREVRAAAPRDFDVFETLRQLRSAHQASFVFGVRNASSAFLGASPELLVRADGVEVRASSLAGSIARGTTESKDAALAADLLASAKDRVEHEIVRRALCACLAELCDDVAADGGLSLLSLPQMHHLRTEVRARLREGHSLLDLVARLHPTPAVGGEPREAALDFIRDHEQLDRGWYAAPIGWLQRGRGEFAVALRSALVTGREALLFAGCGIVADSDPDAEYDESLLKLRPMDAALSASVAEADVPRPVRAAAGRGVHR